MLKSIRDYLFNLIPLRFHLLSFYYYYKLSLKLEPELGRLPSLISGCRTAIDIGANRGLYTYFLSSFCRKVVSFEPQPWCFAKISACSKPNIVSYNVGLSDAPGSLALYIPRDSHGGYLDGLASFRETPDSYKLQVPVKTLDEYALTDVDFIKIDVEGHEFEVLEGARETILRNKPILLIEIEQRHLNRPIDDIFKKIIQLDYEGFYLLNGKLLSISNFSYKTHQLAYLSNVFDKRYINNFFFFPKQAASHK